MGPGAYNPAPTHLAGLSMQRPYQTVRRPAAVRICQGLAARAALHDTCSCRQPKCQLCQVGDVRTLVGDRLRFLQSDHPLPGGHQDEASVRAITAGTPAVCSALNSRHICSRVRGPETRNKGKFLPEKRGESARRRRWRGARGLAGCARGMFRCGRTPAVGRPARSACCRLLPSAPWEQRQETAPLTGDKQKRRRG